MPRIVVSSVKSAAGTFRVHRVSNPSQSSMTQGQSVTIELPSVQALLLESRFEDTFLASATGFVVESNSGPLLITNRHVVTGRDNRTNEALHSASGIPDNLRIRHHSETVRENGPGATVSARESLYQGQQPRWIEHPILGARADIVALPLTETSGVQLFPVDISESDLSLVSRPTETVSVIGFPFGESGSGDLAIWSTGSIASEMQVPYNQMPVFLIDSRTRTGQSGSPVIAYRAGAEEIRIRTNYFSQSQEYALSQFLGVYSGRIHPDSDIGMVWKATALRELVNAAEIRARAT